jgi:hypothetical protein
MKKKSARNVLALLLAFAMTLAFAPLTVSAVAPGVTQESAVELKVGQIGTFGGLSGIMDDWDAHFWYKFQLSSASKVVITQNVPAAPIDHTNWAYVFVTASDTVNEMNRYVDGFGDIKGINLEQGFEAGNLGDSRVITRTATYYLNAGLYYICIACDLDEGIVGTVKIDSIEPISNTGGLTKETARTVDPAKEVIKQTRFDEEDVEGRYYYKFTLPEPAEVSIQKSVKLVPSVDDRQNFGSSLFLEGPDTDMLGTVDGEVDVSPLEIREKDDVLTKTITYSLPKGTYYVYLNCYWSTVGTEYTLSFSMSGASTPTPTPALDGGAMSNYTKSKTYASGQFTDVNENAWYGVNNQKAVASAFEYGLMQGNDATSFDPDANYTVAAAITVAARVHSIYATGKADFTQGSPWYQVYVDYCVANGIINAADFTDLNRPATRAEMAYIFSRALPSAELKEQNTVNSLPDVTSATPYYQAIFALYKAGVVAGSDESGTFKPGSPITRAEAAAIISRVILPDSRFSGKVFG